MVFIKIGIGVEVIMKLNIQVPQGQRRNLRIVLDQGINGKVLKGYCCKQSCNDCNLKSFDTDKGVRISDLDKIECNNCDLETPVFSLKVELDEMEELLVI